ncbi:L-gulonolactone oxidase-like isoform X2 [Montipora capricornis]|uniref:L-gulonolactone oxidase-like isoform X2 n=1 Tax=Montipora capricornis TaxID=246305 RepID=UPI0035F1FA7C
MGNQVDCCYNARWSYQCIFPCIRFCTYTGRRVWYNYDGMEKVQPLVHLYHPQPAPINSFPEDLHGINDHADIAAELKSGLNGVGQLAALCKYATDNQYSIRAVGTGSSWSRLTHTKDILVEMTSLKRFITPEPISREDNMSKEFVDIEVEAGMRVVDFVEQLDRDYGLALDMIGNYAGQTVGGVANTSTHRSGIFSGTMSTLVVGLHLVVSGGIQVKVSGGLQSIDDCKEKIDNAQYGDDPVEIKSDDVLKACAVGLGCMGIVYYITYRCVPMYNIEEIRKKYSVRWTQPDGIKVPTDFEQMYGDRDGEFFSFFVNPYPMKKSSCCGGGVRTAEWCLPLTKLNDALNRVMKIVQDYARIHHQYSLLPIYVRLVKTDDLFLSPASKTRPDEPNSEKNCYIEVPFLPGAYGIDEFQERVENALVKEFKARPHWGKNNKMNDVKLRTCYNQLQIIKWKDVFQIFNRGGLFNNFFTHNMGFDVVLHEPTA